MRIINYLILFGFLLTIIIACEKDTETYNLPNKYYTISNESDITIGLKIHLKDSLKFNESFKDSIILNPKEVKTFYEFSEVVEPEKIFSNIQIFDELFLKKIKDKDLCGYIKNENSINYSIFLPSVNAIDVIDNNHSVNIYIDDSSIYGFFPKNNWPAQMYFFNTPDYFKTIKKTEMLEGTNSYSINRKFDDTIIAFDANVYSEESKILVSNDNGNSWNLLANHVNGFSQDFLTCDFISGTTGWFFIYNDWSYTSVYKVENGSQQQIATLNGYCVQSSKFIDKNNGYIIANTNDNVSPSTSYDLYFMKTTDGGFTWSTPIEISKNLDSKKMFVLSKEKIIVVPTLFFGFKDFVYVSNNRGITWEEQKINIDSINIRDIHFVNSEIAYLKSGQSTGWTDSNIGYIYKSEDGGITWSLQTKSKKYGSSIYFYDEKIGLMQDLKYGQGQILNITTDSGKTWREVLYPYDYILDN